MHEADEPNAVVDFLDAEPLADQRAGLVWARSRVSRSKDAPTCSRCRASSREGRSLHSGADIAQVKRATREEPKAVETQGHPPHFEQSAETYIREHLSTGARSAAINGRHR
jgi:hypothetical protein